MKHISNLQELNNYFKIANLEDAKKGHVKLAILADCDVQQFAKTISGLFFKYDFFLDVYISPIGNIDYQILDDDSELYEFDPDIILLFYTSQNLREYYNKKFDCGDVFKFYSNRLLSNLENIRKKSKALVLQSNFALTNERTFGSFDAKVENSLSNIILKLNHYIHDILIHDTTIRLFDVQLISSSVGLNNWWEERFWFHAKSPCNLDYLPNMAQEIFDIFLSIKGNNIKCVISDLDNTMWGGIVGDDGLEGIKIGGIGVGEAFSHYQYFLKRLKDRGVILAVCSKNDEEIALNVFKNHPDMILREEDITVFVANWENKSDNIKHIKETLNIGYDSLLFLDDNAFERKLVRDLLPEVHVPELPEDPSDYIKYLCSLNYFETSSNTKEDKERTKMYKDEVSRKQNSVKHKDISSFLKSMNMKGEIKTFDKLHLERIVQLIGRSNQFNLTTIRYTREQCISFMNNNSEVDPIYIELEDSIGSYGLISVIILKQHKKELHIDLWLMSCRVIKRGVEDMAMNHVFDIAKKRSCNKVIGKYIPTSKNKLVENFYSDFGFIKDPNDPQSCSLAIYQYTKKVHYISC